MIQDKFESKQQKKCLTLTTSPNYLAKELSSTGSTRFCKKTQGRGPFKHLDLEAPLEGMLHCLEGRKCFSALIQHNNKH